MTIAAKLLIPLAIRRSCRWQTVPQGGCQRALAPVWGAPPQLGNFIPASGPLHFW